MVDLQQSQLTGDQLADLAASYAEKNTPVPAGASLKFVRTLAAAPAGTLDANTAWKQAQHRHEQGTPPRGAFVFWTGKWGHVGISDGRGLVWLPDTVRPGKVDRVPIESVNGTGGLTYAGWTEDINGVRIHLETAPAA